jgi:anti-sigma B factor antagonist
MPFESTSAHPAHDGVPAYVPFNVRPERYRDVYLITVTGELDLATYERLRDELERAEASEAARILLDLGGLTFIDSTGICVLVKAAQRSANDGARLRLLPASGKVHEVLELTGVMERLHFVD